MKGPGPTRRDLLRLGLGLGAASLAGPAWADAGLRRRPMPRPGPSAGHDADTVLQRAGLDGDITWAVLDLDSGAVLDARQPERAMVPASTLKAVTALFALDRLGRDFRFVTRVLDDGSSLVLVGEGDPVLDSDALAALAREVARAGLTPPEAFLVWPRWPAHEIARIDPMQADHLPYNPTISGLNLNFNRVHMAWTGGATPTIRLEARGDKVSPRAYTVAMRAVSRAAPLFAFDGSGPREEWTVSGAALQQPGSRWLPVRRPAILAGDVFQTLARAEGLPLPAPGLGQASPGAREIARHASPPLHVMIAGMLDHSTNLTAEILGLRASGQDGLPQSGAVMADWVRGQGVPGGFEFADHSGLSAQSRVGASMMARLLAGPGQAAGLDALMPRIDRIDADGRRMPWADGLQVRGKSGTLNFVSNLVGTIKGTGGRRLGFAILSRDPARHLASIGHEIPAGVITWTRRARHLQSQLIMHWAGRFG